MCYVFEVCYFVLWILVERIKDCCYLFYIIRVFRRVELFLNFGLNFFKMFCFWWLLLLILGIVVSVVLLYDDLLFGYLEDEYDEEFEDQVDEQYFDEDEIENEEKDDSNEEEEEEDNDQEEEDES